MRSAHAMFISVALAVELVVAMNPLPLITGKVRHPGYTQVS